MEFFCSTKLNASFFSVAPLRSLLKTTTFKFCTWTWRHSPRHAHHPTRRRVSSVCSVCEVRRKSWYELALSKNGKNSWVIMGKSFYWFVISKSIRFEWLLVIAFNTFVVNLRVMWLYSICLGSITLQFSMLSRCNGVFHSPTGHTHKHASSSDVHCWEAASWVSILIFALNSSYLFISNFYTIPT